MSASYEMTLRRLILFLGAGGTATLVSLLVRGRVMSVMPFEPAVVLAHLVGTLVAFSLNRLFVFSTFDGRLISAYLRFLAVNLGSAAITLGVSSALYRLALSSSGLPHSDYIAHFVGLGVAAVPAYLGHARFSFRRSAP